ncbi:hypothetical protein B5E84_01010 [Lachnoclostridium sp. An14]|nr:hypothetical protein B5E84_01010 [Lachnoclostridium sp. An14]
MFTIFFVLYSSTGGRPVQDGQPVPAKICENPREHTSPSRPFHPEKPFPGSGKSRKKAWKNGRLEASLPSGGKKGIDKRPISY